MKLSYAGRPHDEAVGVPHKQKQKAREQAGGEMAIAGTEADTEHSCGVPAELGKQVRRRGSEINGGGTSDVASSICGDASGAIQFAPIAHESRRRHRVISVNVHRTAKGATQDSRGIGP